MLTLYSLGKFPGVDYLCHRVNLFSDFSGIFVPSSTVVILVYISMNSVLEKVFFLCFCFFFFFFHPCRYLLLQDFWLLAILTGVMLNYIAVTICISLTTSQSEHFVVYLLAICISSIEKCLFMSLAHFLAGLCVLFQLNSLNSLYL